MKFLTTKAEALTPVISPGTLKEVKGILLLQLGTPTAPTTKACRAFLREFLMDEKVIDLPYPLRWLLVHGIILPFRAPKTAKAYQSIWTADGSPLRFYSLELAKKLESQLQIPVRVGMRYQTPRISEALEDLKAVSELLVVPLFPQYASATTGSAVEEFTKVMRGFSSLPHIQIFPPFFDQDFFVNAWVEQSIRSKVKDYEHVLFSFHGLPERYIRASDLRWQSKQEEFCVLQKSCCAQKTVWNQTCYRSHCYFTTEAIAQKLKLDLTQYSMCFQSRLGREAWLRPYTEESLIQLAVSGVKKLAVISPSFVCDGLETLEELEIRGREVFTSHGGKEFHLVPGLNLSETWVRGLGEALGSKLNSMKP